ncbi:MAG TPA: hypothetical protein VKY74_07715 [Chloroflexia bacterium]|nr:hypothetical protein [Chloroflexia bacterium]
MKLVRPLRPGARPAGLRLLLGLVLAGLLGLVILAPPRAAAAPAATAGSPSLVFSEIYAPVGGDPQGQWFEIHNTQAQLNYPLNGLILATSKTQLTLHSSVVISGETVFTSPTPSYVLFVLSPTAVSGGYVQPVRGATIIPVPQLGALDPQHDALLLYTPDKSLVIDQVNWGPPDQDRNNWPNYNDQMWNPGLDPLTSPSHSWGRTPADQDTNQGHPGDWTLHETLSPGGKVPPLPARGFLDAPTNLAGGLSSLLLWAAFIIIAIIAYRFERLRDTRTYWQLLLAAPSGLLFYTIVVIVGFSQPGGALTNDQKWLSFPVLLLSAIFCLLAVGIFRNVARGLLEGD